MRLDRWLVENGHAVSRHRAELLIKEGHVKVNGKIAHKNGIKISTEDAVEITQKDFPWVGRGALKLLKAIEEFQINIHGKTCIDVGSSTGGFTEVLLHHGVKKVFAVDVGTQQLVDKIRKHPKVEVYEQTDIRNFEIDEKVDLIVIDVSFISLTQILEKVFQLLKPDGTCIALVKPQFEVQREMRNKRGVVKSPADREKALKDVIEYSKNLGFHCENTIESPITGGDGNVEYLISLSKKV